VDPPRHIYCTRVGFCAHIQHRNRNHVRSLRFMTCLHLTDASHSLESGAIYCFCVLTYVISLSIWSPNGITSEPLINIIRGGLSQIMVSYPLRSVLNQFRISRRQQNIAPLLIIVRVGLGRSVEDTVSGDARRVLPRTQIRFRTPSSSGALSSLVIDTQARSREAENGDVSLADLGK
jgi:hypothetical protein